MDLLPLARRPKAIDMSDMEALVISYDMESEEFKRIAEKSKESESHCQYGPSFLVYERSTGRFLEFFCGNKSSRIESKKLFPFLPLTQADIDAKAAAGNEVGDLEPHGPIPVTLKVKVAENNKGVWHVPVVVKCSTPFTAVAFRRRDLPRNRQVPHGQGQRRREGPGQQAGPRPLVHLLSGASASALALSTGLSAEGGGSDRPRPLFLFPFVNP